MKKIFNYLQVLVILFTMMMYSESMAQGGSIGLQFELENGYYTVSKIDPLVTSEAAIEVGDIVVKISEINAKPKSLIHITKDKFRELIEGEVGSVVVLSTQTTSGSIKEVSLTRKIYGLKIFNETEAGVVLGKKYSDSTLESSEYNYKRKVIVQEDFSSNMKNWKILREKNSSLELVDGNYRIMGNKNTVQFPFILDLNKVENFEIEYDLKILEASTINEYFMSFHWNRPLNSKSDYNNRGYRVVLGKYMAKICYLSFKEKCVKQKTYKLDENWDQTSFHKLKIRKLDSKYTVYIDGQLIVESMHEETYSNKDYLVNSLSVSTKYVNLSINNIKVSEIKKEKKQAVAVAAVAAPTKPATRAVTIPNQYLEAEKKYHALIIGNNEYVDPNLMDLDQPINDAQNLYNVLVSRYTFDKEDVIFLKNATRRDIIGALDKLSNSLSQDDNLLIFYAGHGHWDSKKEIGYWLPVDAERDITVDWLRNSTVQGYIETIDSKHTLLVADACFGGGIFKTRAAFNDADRSINNLYRYESRKAMTSGMLNEVPDRSVFMENLVERLNDNEEKYLSSSNLFYQFREIVMNNSNNAPQYGTVHNTGDKGGDFIFILRD